MSAVPSLAPCKGCKHLGRAGRSKICEFILNTGKCRPCPAGAECTVKETEEREALQVRNRNWDKGLAARMTAEGATVFAIAEACGVNPTTICAWRKRNGISVCNGRRGADRKSKEYREECSGIAQELVETVNDTTEAPESAPGASESATEAYTIERDTAKSGEEKKEVGLNAVIEALLVLKALCESHRKGSCEECPLYAGGDKNYSCKLRENSPDAFNPRTKEVLML